ncbi:hypothetical protein MM236_13610 [Belliella sp. DSM 107340]|uniref:Bacteriocin-type signal sequence n=1 Tax=Belliella calami TaxID=2923436 RepID=A0ABS9UQY6_9BACT|nr:hypothetical protein [Belliella calami]MCH7399036.1 hypothetical protein [Belliella calami]
MENLKELSLADLREYGGGNTVLKLTQNGVLVENLIEFGTGIGETFGDAFTRARSWLIYTK